MTDVTARANEWRCFHCDEVFTDTHSAKLHFGMDQCSDPACKIKMGAEKSLLVALRTAENELADAWAAIHNESTESAKAYYAQQSRHGDQLRAAEELGFERGIRDSSAQILALEAQALRDRKLRDDAQDDALMWRYSIAMGDHQPLLVKVWEQRCEAFKRAAAAEREASQCKIDASNHAADAETVRRERDAAVAEVNRLAIAAYDLSTWAACINWHGGPNEKEWLADLRSHIEGIQSMTEPHRTARTGETTHGN